METIQAMLDELWTPGIWTGWAAFLIFIPLAITSNDTSQRLMRKAWKQLQRWVYPAAVLTLGHWIFVHNNIGPALVHFVPLAALELYRVYVQRSRPLTVAS
jgi:sulfoxide reductase heme-binding subunit YedZ